MQRMCVGWFRLQYPAVGKLLFAVPNGGARSRTEAAIMKAEGVTAGVTDLILLLGRGGFNALCIEMKTTDRRSALSDAQIEWRSLTIPRQTPRQWGVGSRQLYRSRKQRSKHSASNYTLQSWFSCPRSRSSHRRSVHGAERQERQGDLRGRHYKLAHAPDGSHRIYRGRAR